MVSGIIASPGIALGKVIILKEKKIKIKKKKISHKQIKKEIKKFFFGIKNSSLELESLKIKYMNVLNEDQIDIFENQIMLLKDETFKKNVINCIKNDLTTASKAVNTVIKKQIKLINNFKDKYLKARSNDICDIAKRLLKNILNIKYDEFNFFEEKILLVAIDLFPSEVIKMNLHKILGFITDVGGYTSHSSIIARSLSIPAIVGTENITKKVVDGDFLILDAINNKIYINPNIDVISRFKKIRKNYVKEYNQISKKEKKLLAITLDNHKVIISSNINGKFNNLSRKYNYLNGEGIGLYRTEFLFENYSSLPNEEEQFHIYKSVVESVHKITTFRTMDIGGDKIFSYINVPKENNPCLGWRAIRIGLKKKEILHTQLRAILRASAFGKLRILYPMIISVEEVYLLKEEMNFLKYQLKKEKIIFDEKIEIGIMIETPSAAITSHHLAKEVDFFSIGTNDLTQYTLAVDRGNKMISHLYNPMSLAVLILIKKVIDASHQFGKWTGMCGELAGDENATLLLLGMGLDQFSMDDNSIPKIKKIIRKSKFSDAKKLAEKALSQSTQKELNSSIKKI